MDKPTNENQKTGFQWHPAFFAGLQIEFEEEADKLIFENEHQLGTKPKEIDVLIIKKNAEDKITKNIGRIFKGHNIVEYKSPDDYLSIDDFYKVYGYACFYKSDTPKTNEIAISDITITFVCHKYPRELIKHLKTEKNFTITQYEQGIFYIKGDTIMMQLIVTPRLSDESNLWLHNLTNNLSEIESARKLIKEYGKHQNEGLYKSIMNIIVRANPKKFEEDNEMCEALLEIVADKIIEKEHIAEQRGLERGLEAGRAEGQLIEREHNIKVFISDYLEENFSKDKIIKKLQLNFELTPTQAEEYYQKYSFK